VRVFGGPGAYWEVSTAVQLTKKNVVVQDWRLFGLTIGQASGLSSSCYKFDVPITNAICLTGNPMGALFVTWRLHGSLPILRFPGVSYRKDLRNR